MILIGLAAALPLAILALMVRWESRRFAREFEELR